MKPWELVKAEEEGKKIECRRKVPPHSEWMPKCYYSWDFFQYDYRLAPEPPMKIFLIKEVVHCDNSFVYYASKERVDKRQREFIELTPEVVEALKKGGIEV